MWLSHFPQRIFSNERYLQFFSVVKRECAWCVYGTLLLVAVASVSCRCCCYYLCFCSLLSLLFSITSLFFVCVFAATMSADEHVSRYFLRRLSNSTVYWLRKSRLLNALKHKAHKEGNRYGVALHCIALHCVIFCQFVCHLRSFVFLFRFMYNQSQCPHCHIHSHTLTHTHTHTLTLPCVCFLAIIRGQRSTWLLV